MYNKQMHSQMLKYYNLFKYMPGNPGYNDPTTDEELELLDPTSACHVTTNNISLGQRPYKEIAKSNALFYVSGTVV